MSGSTITGAGGSLNFEQNQQGFQDAAPGSTPQGSYVGDVMILPSWSIDTILPDVMIEEVDRYELEITQQPVEHGAPITDHAYKRPIEISMRVGWSNAGNSPTYIDDVFSALQSLQGALRPFSVFTPRGMYQSMLFASLVLTVNEQSSDKALMIQALFRQIIIVDTKSVQATNPVKSPSPATKSKTGHASTPKPQAPKVCSAASNSALNTQTTSFNGVDSLPVLNVG